MLPKRARLLEAYEGLLEECQLEVFLHHHPTSEHVFPSATPGEEEDDGQSESRSGSDEEGSPTSQVQLEESDDHHVGWTEVELSHFFRSLARRSRLFPDLISQDLSFSKSTSQVAHLLSLLERQSNLHEEEIWCDPVYMQRVAPVKAERRYRRIARLQSAHEVSPQWLSFEEEMAAGLRQWQEIDDAEEKGEACANTEQSGSSIEEDIVESGSVISWDIQVTNALLFLRHHPSTCPNTNPANFSYDVPLAASSGNETSSELDLFSFSALLGVQLLMNSYDDDGISITPPSQSYTTFALLHPVPETCYDLEERKEVLAWRVLYRAVELGILAWVKVQDTEGKLPDGEIMRKPRPRLRSTQREGPKFNRFETGRLVWLDTVPGEGNANACERMQQARTAAMCRLMNTLLWEDIRQIAMSQAGQERGTKVQEQSLLFASASPSRAKKREGGDSFKGIDLSAYPPGKLRKTVRARIARRIERYGEVIALAMPIEAQKTGRKRKGEAQEAGGPRKRPLSGHLAVLERQQADEPGDEADDEEDEEDEDEEAAARATSTDEPTRPLLKLRRFDQAGISGEEVLGLLSTTALESLRLFNPRALKRIAVNTFPHHSGTGISPIEGLSHRAIAHLGLLLRDFLAEVISSSIRIVESSDGHRGDPSRHIRPAHVRVAVMQAYTRRRVGVGLSEDVESASVEQFRSDPPCAYHTDASTANELNMQIQGLNSLVARTDAHNQLCSITADAVVAASDAFILPTSSSFARWKQSAAGHDGQDISEADSGSSYEESPVYDDSEQELEVHLRREESRGVKREADPVDGRRWDYNERREADEIRRWERLQDNDEVEAAKHERTLWTRMDLEERADMAQQAQLSSDEDEDSDGGGGDDDDSDPSETGTDIGEISSSANEGGSNAGDGHV